MVYQIINTLAGITIYKHDVLCSTQLKIKELIDQEIYSEFTCIQARSQTNGIGRNMCTWISYDGCCMFSYAFCSKKKDSFNWYPILCSIVSKAMDDFNVDHFLKWPNDIYIDKSKVCGILIEIYKGYIIIGIGANLRKFNANYGTIEGLSGIIISDIDFIEKTVRHTVDTIRQMRTESGFWNDHLLSKFDLKDMQIHQQCVEQTAPINIYTSNTMVQLKSYTFPGFIHFEGVILKFITVKCGHIIAIDDLGNPRIFSPQEYSYDVIENRVHRK